LALSYSGGSSFPDPKDGTLYYLCIEELSKGFSERYRQACLLEKKQEWAEARDAFRKLLDLLGGGAEQNPVFENVQKHFGRVKYYHQKTQKKDRKGVFG